MKVLSLICTAETLTPNVNCVPATHERACEHAAFSAHSPSSRIWPVSSATGMKSEGE
jgi:hypothetical protein